MPTYRNKKFGLEIDLPDGWAVTRGLARLPAFLSNLFLRANILEEFALEANEWLNIVVDRMEPEIPPDVNEMIFSLNAQAKGYTGVAFSRITIGGREHACASYSMNQRGWLKKYMVMLNGYGYALTASCPLANKSAQVEAAWDRIAASLRLLNPPDPAITAYNNSPEVRRSIAAMRQQVLAQLEQRKNR